MRASERQFVRVKRPGYTSPRLVRIREVYARSERRKEERVSATGESAQERRRTLRACSRRAALQALVDASCRYERKEKERERERERRSAEPLQPARPRFSRDEEEIGAQPLPARCFAPPRQGEREKGKSKVSLARPRACEQVSASLVDTEVQEAAAGERKVHRRGHARRSCVAIDVRRCATELRACVRVCASARTHDTDSCERGRTKHPCVYILNLCICFASGAIN